MVTEKISSVVEIGAFIQQQALDTLQALLVLTLLAGGLYYLLKSRKEDIERLFSFESSTFDDSNTNFVTKMKKTGRNVVIFYGSQTGTAEEFSSRLAKEANRYGFKAMVADPEEYLVEDLPQLAEIENCLLIFVVATYGEGDPTDNFKEFYHWMETEGANLKGINYAVFGLGNKTYEYFNTIGIYVDKRLSDFGATRVYEIGLADEDACNEEDFITWKERFWKAVCEHFKIKNFGEDVIMRQYELSFHDDISKENVFTGEIARLGSYTNQMPPYDKNNPFLSKLLVNRELYRGDRSCMHIELDISGTKMRYEAGDHVAIYPTNNPELVEKIGNLLNADLDTVFSLNNLDEDSSKKHPFPCPTSYRTALLHYVDITSVPRTHVLKEIAEYASNEDEKKLLKLMATSTEEGKRMYSDWAVENNRSILHVLEDLPSVKPPIDYLLELLPRLQARYYSISSSQKMHPFSIHVTAVLVEYSTKTNRNIIGVTTGWLKTLKASENSSPELPIFIRRSQFRLPNNPATPIIMIGPGTGLAPFRGFLQERAVLKSKGKVLGESVLFFGCRHEKEDFLYAEELKKYVAEGLLTKLHLAFSRDQPEKKYVTHLLKKNKNEIWKLIGEKDGYIYICGDARHMAKDVHNIITEVIEEYGHKSKKEAESYIKKMEFEKRYSADVWS